MIVQVQDFFKDVNARRNVLNIRQPVLQVITVLSFEKWHQGSENSSEVIVKNSNVKLTKTLTGYDVMVYVKMS